METEKTTERITIELTDAYFRTKDGDIQGKYNKGMTQATWEQIKKNAGKEYERQFQKKRGTTNNQKNQEERK